MEKISPTEDAKEESKRFGIFKMPKAVPAILLNILLERFSTTATSGNRKKLNS